MFYMDKVADWYHANYEPCKRCLVKPACKHWTDCDLHNKFRKRYQTLESVADLGDTIIILGCFIIAILWFLATIGMGLWKQIELISKLFN